MHRNLFDSVKPINSDVKSVLVTADNSLLGFNNDEKEYTMVPKAKTYGKDLTPTDTASTVGAATIPRSNKIRAVMTKRALNRNSANHSPNLPAFSIAPANAYSAKTSAERMLRPRKEKNKSQAEYHFGEVVMPGAGT